MNENRLDQKQLPLMEQLEKDLAMLADNMTDIADAFERIYTVFPAPVMKPEDGKPMNPEDGQGDRLSQAIKSTDRLKIRASRLTQKINVTLDTVIGSSQKTNETGRT